MGIEKYEKNDSCKETIMTDVNIQLIIANKMGIPKRKHNVGKDKVENNKKTRTNKYKKNKKIELNCYNKRILSVI